jgi:hypothetical protein
LNKGIPTRHKEDPTMTAVRKNLMILTGLTTILALAGCSRDITYNEVVEYGPSSCFDCHSDQSTFLVAAEAQWANSRHGMGEVVFEGESAGCARCHCSEGFIDYVAGNEVTGYENPTMIHCFTCHSPHSDGDFGLRTDAPVTFANEVEGDIGSGNLCLNCHQSRRDVRSYVVEGVSVNSRFGPHYGPQGDMLFATGGFEFEGYTYGDMDFHRNQTVNEDGCLGCHFKKSEGFTLGGHSFNMEGDVEGESMLHYDACIECHAVLEDQEDFDYNGVQTEVAALLDELQTLLFAAGFVDEDGVLTSGTRALNEAGAIYNFRMVREDRSMGVHNSDYAKDLLQSAIDYLESAAK